MSSSSTRNCHSCRRATCSNSSASTHLAPARSSWPTAPTLCSTRSPPQWTRSSRAACRERRSSASSRRSRARARSSPRRPCPSERLRPVTATGDVRVDVAVTVDAEVGEGPHWDATSETLWFVDITRGSVFRHRDGNLTRFAVGQEVGAAIPRQGGGLVLAVRDGIATASDNGDDLRVVVPIEGDRLGNRMNDAKCDPAGRLFAGTCAFDLAPDAGTLYRIDPDWSYVPVVERVTTSNGIAWSPDASRMYFIDSGAGGVDVFDYDVTTGALSDRTRLATIDPDDGVPDGMTVDADGQLWVACFDGWAVRCYAPSGEPLGVINLPVAQVTSCAFGGSDLSELYVTSACYQLSEEQQAREPLAGSTFVCRPGVAGLPASAFAG